MRSNCLLVSGLALGLGLLPAGAAFAGIGSSEKRADQPSVLEKLRLSGSIGALASGSTAGRVNDGAAVSDLSGNSASPGPAFGLELEAAWSPYFHTSIAADYSVYNYDVPGMYSDQQISFGLIPKVVLPWGAFELWAGAGMGLFIANVRSGSDDSWNGGRQWHSKNDPLIARFILTPRIGFDYHLTGDLAVGFQVSYFQLGYDRSEIEHGVRISEDLTRSWWTTSFKVSAALF